MAAEYRADRLADMLLGQMVTIGQPGSQQRASSWAMSSEDYLANVRMIVDRAYPTWPDLVQAYRERRLELGAMWAAVVAGVDQTITAILHAQAAADSTSMEIDVLAAAGAATLPACRLYLSDGWSALLTELRRQPILPRITEVGACDAALVTVGERALLGIMDHLGLTPLEHESGGWGVLVDAPAR